MIPKRFLRRGWRAAICASAALLVAARGAPPAASAGDVTVAVAGDLLGPYHPVLALDDPQFAEVVRLIRGADIGFANQEGSLFDLSDYKGYPAAENGGGLPLASSAVAAEFKAMGITMMSKANNHATDWSIDGLELTERTLDAKGIVHAGSGASETAARAAAFLETPKGRFALVATASSFTPMSRAADADASRHVTSLRTRPGISVIASRKAIEADPGEMAALRAMAERRGGKEAGGAVTLGSQTFVPGTPPLLHYTADATDQNAVLASVQRAAATGAFTIFSIHAHETASSDREDPAPADFLPPLFHRAIDDGAALVVRHGPHALSGIEIYKGRPIFYGMASLFFDFGPKGGLERGGHFMRFPAAWFDSALALARYHDGALREVRIYPLVMAVNDGPTCGLPRLAHGADAARILGKLRKDSAAFGTRIAIRGDIGVITVSGA